jgi:hypothetical protein
MRPLASLTSLASLLLRLLLRSLRLLPLLPLRPSLVTECPQQKNCSPMHRDSPCD